MEKLQIRPTGYQCGQPRVYVENGIISDPEKHEDILGFTIEPQVNTRTRVANLSLDYGKYWLKLQHEPGRSESKWHVKHVTINLARCLFGHNARLILNDNELQAALTIANNLLNKVVTPDGVDLLIPGITPESRSYHNDLEIANQVRDPGSVILNLLKHARLKHYSADHLEYEDIKAYGTSESIYIGSKDKPIFTAYRKDREITQRKRKRFDGDQREPWQVAEDHRDCLRIETRLHGRKMINTMLCDGNAYRDGERLITFRMEDVFAAYQRVLSELRGVFHDPGFTYNGPAEFKEVTSELIERLKKNPTATPLFQILQALQKERGYGDVAIGKIRVNVESWLEHSSTTSLDQILPLAGVCEPMQIEPMKKDGDSLVPVFQRPRHPLVIDDRIAKAYGGLSTLNIRDIQGPDLPWLKDGSWQTR